MAPASPRERPVDGRRTECRGPSLSLILSISLTVASVDVIVMKFFFLKPLKKHSQWLCDDNPKFISKRRGTSCPNVTHSVLVAADKLLASHTD